MRARAVLFFAFEAEAGRANSRGDENKYLVIKKRQQYIAGAINGIKLEAVIDARVLHCAALIKTQRAAIMRPCARLS